LLASGAGALQLDLDAVGRSDGTRRGVRDAAFAGDAVPRSRSLLGAAYEASPRPRALRASVARHRAVAGQYAVCISARTPSRVSAASARARSLPVLSTLRR
jgi:hypothetical protein